MDKIGRLLDNYRVDRTNTGSSTSYGQGHNSFNQGQGNASYSQGNGHSNTRNQYGPHKLDNLELKRNTRGPTEEEEILYQKLKFDQMNRSIFND